MAPLYYTSEASDRSGALRASSEPLALVNQKWKLASDSDDTITSTSDSELSDAMSVEDPDPTPSQSSSSTHQRPTPPADSPTETGISMILRAAILLERNQVPCTSPRCPINHPHPEGLYRHPGPVPDSALANIYFAPSIPPPAVVACFNNIEGMPSWLDLNTKDGFFENHTLPCRPSKHLEKVLKANCNSQHCGVEHQGKGSHHKKGLYLHDGLDPSASMARRVDHLFGLANPPPSVWEAAFRIKEGGEETGDRDSVDSFLAHHTRFAEDGLAHQFKFADEGEGQMIGELKEELKKFKQWQKEWIKMHK